MSERAMDEIKSNILEQIYNHNGGIELKVLFGILETSYGISEKTFDNIASQLVADNICIIERIVNLDKDEVTIIFMTSKGLERLEETKKIDVKQIFTKKLTYEMKCEGCKSYSEWIENIRSNLEMEKNITRMYARLLVDMSIVSSSDIDKDETSSIFETAINREKDRVKKVPKIQNTIDYAVVMAIYEKSIKLIGKDNLVYEAKKMRRIVESIMLDRHSLLESFL
jgi:hypothetical protein